jgi:hypothetical protein
MKKYLDPFDELFEITTNLDYTHTEKELNSEYCSDRLDERIHDYMSEYGLTIDQAEHLASCGLLDDDFDKLRESFQSSNEWEEWSESPENSDDDKTEEDQDDYKNHMEVIDKEKNFCLADLFPDLVL